MNIYVRERTLQVPAAFTINFRDLVDYAGPFIVAFAYWTTATDAGAGNFSATLSWQDPIGQTRTVAPGSINLNASGAIATQNPVFVRCNTGSSLFTLASTYAGTPGTARYDYSLIFTTAEQQDLYEW